MGEQHGTTSRVPGGTSAGNGWTVRAIFAEGELLQYAETWKRLCRHPNADWDLYWHINRVREYRPCILELRERDVIRALWVGRIESAVYPLRFGYFDVCRLNLSSLNIITGGVLGDASERSCMLLLKYALQIQKELAIDILALSYLPTNHPLARLSGVVPRWICRDWGTVVSDHWKMSLPMSFAEFLRTRSEKHRYRLKRLYRVLENAFPGQIRIRAFQTPEEVDEFCRDAGSVAQTTYQDKLGAAFRADEDYRTRCHLLASKGALRAYILYIGEEPKAYWMATAFADTIYLNVTGYDPAFRRFGLGSILFLKLVEDHCGTAFRKLDFGHGGAEYKERFGDENLPEAIFRIYRQSFRSVYTNCVISAHARLSSGVKRALSVIGLLQRVKTRWRKYLSS